MAIRRAKPGQTLAGLSAGTWNTFCDAAQEVQALQRQGIGFLAGNPTQGSRVRVKNATGTALAKGSVVHLDQPLYGPSANLDEFKFKLTMRGSVPGASTGGRVGILLEPLPEDGIGRALVSGVTVCLVEVTDAGATRAVEISGDATKLRTANHGGIAVLWLAGSSGTQWAVVCLGGASQVDAAASPSHLITTASLIGGSSPSAWKYNLKRGVTNTSSGAVGAASGAPVVYAYNDFEDQTAYAHGQPLTLSNGATLAPTGPCEGPVEAWFSGTYDADGTPIYRFDAPTPMEVACE